MLSKHPNPLRAIVASVVLIVTLAGGAYLLVTRDFQTATVVHAPLASPLQSEGASPSVEPTTDPYEGWLTFTSKKVGVTFRYPPNQVVVTEYVQSTDSGGVEYIESNEGMVLLNVEEGKSVRLHLPIEGYGGNYDIRVSKDADQVKRFSSFEAPPVDGESYLEFKVETRQLAGRNAYFYRYVSGPAAAYEPLGGVYQAYRILLSENMVAEVMFPHYSKGSLEDLELIAASLTAL